MKNAQNLSKPIYSLTVGEFMAVIDEHIESLVKTKEPAPQNVQESEPRYEYSNKAAAKRLGVSVVTFHYWKKKKLFSLTQIGRKCTYDIPLIREELQKTWGKIGGDCHE